MDFFTKVSSFSLSVKIINHKIHMKCFIWLRRQNLVIQKWRDSFYFIWATTKVLMIYYTSYKKEEEKAREGGDM